MGKALTPRNFAAHEASDVAHLVADHSPETPRTVAFIPIDEDAADASVQALVDCLEALPGSIRSALKRAGESAAFLSDDRLQGLAELIQNADDLGATEATVAIDDIGSRLLFSHNGAPLTLHDVWALAIPWLSLKVADEDQLGRFGIGLKTLHALSEVLEVTQGHFRVRFDSRTIQPLEQPIGWSECDPSMTTFAVPFATGAVATEDAVRWLRHWDDAGLVFLRHLSSVRLVDAAGSELVRLQLTYDPEELLEIDGRQTTRRRVTAADGREWLVYNRSAASPHGAERAGKARGTTTPLALAVALFEGDLGHIHVGLPVREIGVPFRILAQFDPQPSRRDIAETSWNLALIPLVSDLWRDAALDLFRLAPSRGWAAVPMMAEFLADSRNAGRLGAHLEKHLLRRARIEFAEALTLLDSGTSYPLVDLGYEAAELTAALMPGDVQLISGRQACLAETARSADVRWREVLDDLRDIGAPTPTMVSVEDASILLNDNQRTPEFIADLLAIVIEAGLGPNLKARTCLVLDDGSRVSAASRTSLDVLLPPDPDPIWALLKIGSSLHPAFSTRAGWSVVRAWLQAGNWLRSSATGADAVAVLARAGSAGAALNAPLSDAQLEGLRLVIEGLPEAERSAVGAGIGRAVNVDAVVYEVSGARSKLHARPCDAYFIEREANTWFVAAAKTPGLIWIDRRYSEKVRSGSGREGVGAQRLFRLLGAEVAPRIKSHSNNSRPLPTQAPGVSEAAPGSPARRREAMRHLQASHTVQDWSAPDLDAVLKNIAKEQDAGLLRRRARAVLGTLTRAWERLDERARVEAATPYYTWQRKGTVDAWWVFSAASIAWLSPEKGKPRAPHELRIKSSATVALYGDDPERYLSPALDIDAHRDVLARLGVAGDPSAAELIQRLEQVRAESSAARESAEDLAAPLYQALAAQVREGRLGGHSAGSTRSAFARGDGLIATRGGWRRPSVVLAGPPIFRELRDFVPSVSGTDALWSLLGVHRPTPQDARGVLNQLARKRSLTSDEKLIMLEALRLLTGLSAAEQSKLGRAAVWVGDRWERHRPVYATGNALIAQGLKDRVPIWSPGGALVQLAPLVDAYRLTRLDALHGRVLNANSASLNADLTQLFAVAVTNLRSDLAMSDPNAEEALRISWDELAALRVKQVANLRVRLVEPSHGMDEIVDLDSWLDLPAGVLYTADEGAIGSPSSGAHAIASVFDGDARRIAHDWVAAWSMALEGHREEVVTTAARLDAERKQERDERSNESLRKLSDQGKERRSKSGSAPSVKEGEKDSTRAIIESAPKPARQLVDPDHLTLKDEDGEIVGGTPAHKTDPGIRKSTPAPAGPRDPDPSNPKKPFSGSERGAKNYTEQEREAVGLDLVRRVLGGDHAGIVDIRHQHNVGADAIDDLENFFELKVYAGAIPETISLTRSEFRRAQETEQFFLVVVGNVEQGREAPEVLIFTDPLNHLKVLPQGSVNLGGIRNAKALRYTFES